MKTSATRTRDLILPAHLIAISMWIEALRLLPRVPRAERIAFANGRHGAMSGLSPLAPLAPYALLILVGFLPNEIWRMLGVALARGLDEDAAIIVFARAVATAILTGVVAKLVIFAPGALASVSLALCLGAAALGLAAFFAIRRSVFAGVVTAIAAVVAGVLVFGQ